MLLLVRVMLPTPSLLGDRVMGAEIECTDPARHMPD